MMMMMMMMMMKMMTLPAPNHNLFLRLVLEKKSMIGMVFSVLLARLRVLAGTKPAILVVDMWEIGDGSICLQSGMVC